MPYKVIFRAEARDEALDAADYIAEHGSPEIALRWYEGLEAAVASLAEMPARCGYAGSLRLRPRERGLPEG